MEADKQDHGRQNAIGWSQTIRELVAALEVDYDKLEELRDERETLDREVRYYAEDHESEEAHKARRDLAEWDEANGEELKDLADAAEIERGYPIKSQDEAHERIQESVLSIEVRSGWQSPGEELVAEEFAILLTTGGPALRIRGELNEYKQPTRAWLEYQDWGTPWTEFRGAEAPSQDDLLTFSSVFYFGE
jgi:hypothetical protein